jgi:DNA replication protein DnaC
MAEDPMKAVLHYAQALKAPRIRESAARLAEQARDAGWTHEEYLAAVLSREVAAREASGAATRIRSAGFPTRKSLEDFNFDHQPALNRDMIAHLGTGAFLAKSRNVVLLGPPVINGW